MSFCPEHLCTNAFLFMFIHLCLLQLLMELGPTLNLGSVCACAVSYISEALYFGSVYLRGWPYLAILQILTLPQYDSGECRTKMSWLLHREVLGEE